MDSHFPPETANHWTSVTPPQLLALGVWEKDQEDYMGVIKILLSLETNQWCSAVLGVLLCPSPDLLWTMKLHLMRKVLLQPSTDLFVGAVTM